MIEQITNDESGLSAEQIVKEIKEKGNFDILPCDNTMNIDDNPKFKKLELTSGQKMQLSALASQLPAVMAVNGLADTAAAAANLWVMEFPSGIPCSLVRLKQGGYMNMLRASNGRFLGAAPLYPVDSSLSQQIAVQAAVLGTFSAMSVVTGQYYLTRINSELKTIQQGMDKILEFLYGDKKAELMAEVSFAKYAYENYSSIMAQESQKSATIASLQNARKIAMKDSEFYISDLSSTLQEDSDIGTMVGKACSIQESLNLALQLCVMSSILEVYYSQNFNPEYLKYIEHEVTLYINKCEKHILNDFAKLHDRVEKYKGTPLKKVDKNELLNKINKVLKSLNNGDESELKKSLCSGLYSLNRKATYYLSDDGNVYIKDE